MPAPATAPQAQPDQTDAGRGPATVLPPAAATRAAAAESDDQVSTLNAIATDTLARVPARVPHRVGKRHRLERGRLGKIVTRERWFNVSAVLAALYGAVITEKGEADRTEWRLGRAAPGCDVRDWERGRVVATWVVHSARFVESGVHRGIIVFATGWWVESNDSSCSACAPHLGAAFLTEVDGGWRLDAWTTFIESVGRLGHPPESLKLVRLGNARHGFLARVEYSKHGYSAEWGAVFAEHQGQVIKVIELPTLRADNSGDCPAPGESSEGYLLGRPCYRQTAAIEFVPVAGAPAWRLKLHRERKRAVDAGFDVSRSLLVYDLVGSRYQLDDAASRVDEAFGTEEFAGL